MTKKRMAVKPRVVKDDDLEKKRKEFIEKGSDSYDVERKKRKAIILRIPMHQLEKLDSIRQSRPGVSRSALILQGIQDLIKRAEG